MRCHQGDTEMGGIRKSREELALEDERKTETKVYHIASDV